MTLVPRPSPWLATLVPLAVLACTPGAAVGEEGEPSGVGGEVDTGTDAPVDTEPDADEDTDVPCPADEIPYNGIDDDCDPTTPDDDLDGDGDLAAVDCDDDPTRGPHADDVGWDGVDQDCDGVDLTARPAQPSRLVDLRLTADLLMPAVAVDGGELPSTTSTVADAVVGDPRRADEEAALLDTAPSGSTAVFLVSVGTVADGTWRLTTSGR